jgi:hypothetical protein
MNLLIKKNIGLNNFLLNISSNGQGKDAYATHII